MDLKQLTLQNYRNLEHARLRFGARFTVLHGHNGAGKTNILEAIYLVSTLRSFRTNELGSLVQQGEGDAAPQAVVDLDIYDPKLGLDSKLSVRLSRQGSSTRRAALADGKTVRSATDFYGRVQAVLFTPEDLGVLRGTPQGRRRFLDRMLFSLDRAHIGDVQTYEKILRSRNRVLRREEGASKEREGLVITYELQLAAVGARIWRRRARLVELLRAPFAAAFAQIHGVLGPDPSQEASSAPSVDVCYQSKAGTDLPEDPEALLLQMYAERRSEDLRRGQTTVGPHRDDLLVLFAGQGAAEYASQGQARALVLALKLAELQASRQLHRAAPLLLLDDVSSELDPERNALLFRALAAEAGQCVLTTTASDFIRLPADAPTLYWSIDRGRVAQ